MAEKSYTVTSYAWCKDTEGRLRKAGEDAMSDGDVLTSLSGLARFLESNGLVTRRLTDRHGNVGEDFVLRSDDLTELGTRVLKASFSRWERQEGRPGDVRVLERALAKLKH